MKTNLLISLLFLSIALLNSGCEESVDGNKLELKSLLSIFKKDNGIAQKSSVTIDTVPTTREGLEDMKTVVKIYNGSDNAGLTVPGFGGIKLGKEESNINVYYIETKTVKIGSDTVVYGIGYSAHYLFKKVKKGLDIANMPYVAASVQIESNKTQVYYSLQTYGVISVSLVKYFKPVVNKPFDVEGFGIIQSSIDGIQNVLGDTALSKSVKFTPELLKNVKPLDLN